MTTLMNSLLVARAGTLIPTKKFNEVGGIEQAALQLEWSSFDEETVRKQDLDHQTV